MTTTSKALKKLVRARMKRTGETYGAALAALRADTIKHVRAFTCRWCKSEQLGALMSTGVIIGHTECPSGPALDNHHPGETRFRCQAIVAAKIPRRANSYTPEGQARRERQISLAFAAELRKRGWLLRENEGAAPGSWWTPGGEKPAKRTQSHK
jgi:hypothetical protein